MRQHFDICGDYQADNPFGKRQPLKHSFMKYAFLVYKKARVSISKFRPLKEWQEYLWREDFDTEMFFSIRFLNEIEAQTNNSFSYITLRPSKKTLISILYTDLFESIQKTIGLYNGINSLFQSNIDYLSAKNNFSTQNKALGVSILAVIVAIISIIITVIIAIATNEDVAIRLIELLRA